MHGDLARRRVDHRLWNSERIDARPVLAIDATEAVVESGLSASAGTDDRGGTRRERRVQDDARMRDRLARCNDAELRHAVERRNLPLLEMAQRIETLDLTGDLLREVLEVGAKRDRAEAADPLPEVLPVGWNVVAERRDGADAGDDDPVHDCASTSC